MHREDRGGGLQATICAVRMIQHVQMLKDQEAKELRWSVIGICFA